MQLQEIKQIMKENKKYLNMLEEYDRTGVFPLQKIRRSFTLKQMTVKKLKSTSKNTGKSMSDILDELVDKKLE